MTTTHVLLKSRPANRGTAQQYELTRTALALALFIPASKINLAPSNPITKSCVRYNPHINQPDTPDLPLRHYRNYVKGFRFGDVWTIDAELKSDKMLIKNFKDLYGGIVDSQNYDDVKCFVKLKAQLNSLKRALRLTQYQLFHIEPSEQSYLDESIKKRMEEIQLEVNRFPANLMKRRF